MKKNLLLFLGAFGLLAAIGAGVLINGNQINPQTAISISSMTVTGSGGMTVSNSVTASSFTATGNGFKGAGTSLTGTATALSIGGNAATATSATSATSASTATSVAGGATGSLLYQSAANATAMLAAGTASQVLIGGASAPSWSGALSITSLVTSAAVTVGTSFSVAGSTVVVGTNGIVDFGSQPSVCLRKSGTSSQPAVATQVFYDSADFNQQNMWVASSSGTITIPTGGAGIYKVSVGISFSATASGNYRGVNVYKNAARTFSSFTTASNATVGAYPQITGDISLVAGDTLKVFAETDFASGTIGGDAPSNWFCVRKY